MKIVYFGLSHTGGAGYDFEPYIQQTDDWITTLAPVVTPVAGAGGVFDFFDDNPFPVSAITVTLSFTVSDTYANIEDIFDDIREKITAAGRSRLWLLRRDGSRGTLNDHRWAWAKCISGPGTPEKYDEGNYVKAPVELTFLCPEGLWYGALIAYDTTQASPQAVTVTNNGNRPALARFDITPSGGTMTSISMVNAANGSDWTFAGSVSAGDVLSVNAKTYNVTNDDVDAYSDLTLGSNQVAWLWLDPGINYITATYTGASARVHLVEVNDTYVL